jgi:hypothetical protein
MPEQPRKLTGKMKLLFVGGLFIASLLVHWALAGEFTAVTVIWAVVFTLLMSALMLWSDGLQRKNSRKDDAAR